MFSAAADGVSAQRHIGECVSILIQERVQEPHRRLAVLDTSLIQKRHHAPKSRCRSGRAADRLDMSIDVDLVSLSKGANDVASPSVYGYQKVCAGVMWENGDGGVCCDVMTHLLLLVSAKATCDETKLVTTKGVLRTSRENTLVQEQQNAAIGCASSCVLIFHGCLDYLPHGIRR